VRRAFVEGLGSHRSDDIVQCDRDQGQDQRHEEAMALRRSQWALIVIAVFALAAAGAYWLAGTAQKPVAEKTPILPPKTNVPMAPAASVAPAKPVVPAAPIAPADGPSKLVTGLRPIRIPPAPQVNPAPPQ
jgi:hypothetical protein